MQKSDSKRERDIMNIMNCIAVSFFGRKLSEKIREIEGMDYPDDVKKEAVERLKKRNRE